MLSSSTTLTLLLLVQVLSALSIIVLVLLQQGKGADMGSSFGSGSAGSLFGATGAANFLSRTTKWAAVVFFVATAGLAYMSHHRSTVTPDSGGVMQGFDRSVPQIPGAVPAGNNEVPQLPDNEVPQLPSAPSPQAADAAPPAVAAELPDSVPGVPSVPTAPQAQ